MTESCLLIGDIGGTNARFALADNNAPGYAKEMTLKCADFASANLAIKHYLDAVEATTPKAICLAAAGVIIDQRVRFTNNDWVVDARELAAEFSAQAVRLLNDFEAIAYSVPLLPANDCLQIGPRKGRSDSDGDFTFGIVGPGTGLGAVGLCQRNGALFPVASEASHGGFAPESRLQMDMLAVLRERYDRVSDERIVSGPGLENIYWALTRIHGEQRLALTAAEIFSKNADGNDTLASEAVQLFFEVLGQIAGDFVLALGAYDGMYIAGGIVQRYPELVARSPFRNGFENKGRYRPILERVPTQLIMHPNPGLLGAAFIALRMTAKR